MSRTKHDYVALRLEYIQTPDLSIRELCKRHGITNWSTVNEMKRKQKWDEDREKLKTQASEIEISHLVDERMKQVAAIHGELLLAVQQAVRRYINDLADKDKPGVSARDLMGLIDKFLLLTGQATSRSESKQTLDVHDFGGLLAGAPPALLRELAELARENGAGAQPVGRGPLIVLEGTRSA
jgi:hypothetical protein